MDKKVQGTHRQWLEAEVSRRPARKPQLRCTRPRGIGKSSWSCRYRTTIEYSARVIGPRARRCSARQCIAASAPLTADGSRGYSSREGKRANSITRTCALHCVYEPAEREKHINPRSCRYCSSPLRGYWLYRSFSFFFFSFARKRAAVSEVFPWCARARL